MQHRRSIRGTARRHYAGPTPTPSAVRRSGLATLAAVTLVVSVLAGCSSGDSENPSNSKSTSTNNQNTTTGSETGEKLEDLKFELAKVPVDLDSPIAAIPLPTGHGLLVAERAGVVRVLNTSGGEPELSDPVIDISSDVSTDMERGLLGLAFNKSADRLILSYTNRDGNSRLDSYKAIWNPTGGDDPGELSVDKSSRHQLLAVDQPYPNHNGGHIELGPDGLLYFGLGDGGAAGDPHGNAQDRSTLLGKMVRINPDATSDADLVPDDNPFVDTPGAKPEIWSTGLRNPWRFSFDPANGDMWIADVGQDTFEEIDRVTQQGGGAKGANFGWDLYEGEEAFSEPNPAKPPASDGPFTKPVFVYKHGPGCSVTGGVVYRGNRVPALVGRYLYSDFCDGTIRALTPSGPGRATSADLGVKADQVAGFATDDSGEVYVISLSEGLFRLEAS